MNVLKKIVNYETKTFSIQENKIISEKNVTKSIEFEIGLLAKQADAAVKVTSGGTSVLCCVVAEKNETSDIFTEDFVPLTVDYRERTYAAGKIPGGFFKREGKPREHEIHVSRLIDRTLRPLFDKEVDFPVQINVLVLSFDPENDPAILSVLGCSCAAMLSGIPFNGPSSCLRLCKINNEYVINPSFQEREIAEFELVASFVETENQNKVLMIEFEGKEIQEQEIVTALQELEKYVPLFQNVQKEIVKEFPKKNFYLHKKKYDIDKLVKNNFVALADKISEVLKIELKQEREEKYKILAETVELSNEFVDEEILKDEEKTKKIKQKVFFRILREVVRKQILDTKIRPDGRKFDQLREIYCDVGILPRTHGSALFQRGQTQALVAITLGTSSDMQIMDELVGEYKERFMFHYNFPGFATGEVKLERGVSRRELGHGFLAKKALRPVLPTEEEFPYTIRVVSDILESNGSSSMASVCGGSLAMFDAGIKLKSAVAGVALGLIYENENQYVILTDIAGIEDHAGDMDFKIAGTKKGITAIQLDLKIRGISLNIITETLNLAKTARMQILDVMNSKISAPKKELSQFAPKIKMVQIPVEKIGDLIGPRGKNIKQIIEETQVKIEIDDSSGKVFISADTEEALNSAAEIIECLSKDVEVGKVYKGNILKVVDYGAFIEIFPGKVGLLHISQIADRRIRNINSVLKEGEKIYVKVIGVDSEGRPILSRKEAVKLGYE